VKQRSLLVDLAFHMALGAIIWGGGLLLYGVAEMLMNTAVGLYQTPGIWSFTVGVYAIAGTVAGLAGGLGVGLLQRVRARVSWLPQILSGPLLMGAYLGGFAFLVVALPLNDRYLGGVFEPFSLLTNGALFLICFGIGALAYWRLGGAPRRGLAYANLAFWYGLALASSMYIDKYVSAGADRPYVLTLGTAVLLGCAAAFFLTSRGLRRAPVGGAVALVALGLLFFVVRQPTLGSDWTASKTDKPNVLWIVMDTVRADHLALYGYGRDTSPSLDALASEGTAFEHAVSQAPWTIPSHFQMITSRFEAGKSKILEPDFVTAAEIMKANGYDTGAVLANLSLGRRSGFDQGFDTVMDGPAFIFFQAFNDKLPVLKWLSRSGLLPPDAVVRWFHGHTFQEGVASRAADITDRALGWMQSRDGRPFFMFINYMDAHDSYDPPEPYRSRFADGVNPLLGFVRYDPEADEAIDSNTFVRDMLPDMDDEDWRNLIDLYDGELAYLDANLGRIFDSLEKAGIDDDTIIVVTADHGELFGEHGLAYHFKALTEEETHVPLIIRFPPGIPKGQRIATTVEVNDVLPTILELTGVSTDAPMDGQSLVELSRAGDSAQGSESAEAFTYLLREPDKRFPHTAPGHLFGVKRGHTKYVWSSGGLHEFYDLEQDPAAHRNLYGEDERPEVAADAARVAAWRKRFGLEDIQEEKLDRVTRDRLKALGYID